MKVKDVINGKEMTAKGYDSKVVKCEIQSGRQIKYVDRVNKMDQGRSMAIIVVMHDTCYSSKTYSFSYEKSCNIMETFLRS